MFNVYKSNPIKLFRVLCVYVRHMWVCVCSHKCPISTWHARDTIIHVFSFLCVFSLLFNNINWRICVGRSTENVLDTNFQSIQFFCVYYYYCDYYYYYFISRIKIALDDINVVFNAYDAMTGCLFRFLFDKRIYYYTYGSNPYLFLYVTSFC